MRRALPFLTLFAAVTATGLAAPPPATKGSKVDFSAEIRPIIAKKCYHCHGPDESSRKAKLRLDSFEEATRGVDQTLDRGRRELRGALGVSTGGETRAAPCYGRSR